ncbi:MAG: 1-phosphofructokinase family hexose kinase, partial [Alphaproteobacteria bacterium]
MSAILTVTVNPSLDVTTSTARVEPQRKLRCGPPVLDAGGGGANVSRAIRELGGDSRAFIALGGSTGRQYAQQLGNAGVDFVEFPLTGETRSSMTVMEEASGLHYRFVLPGPEQSPQTGEEMLAELGRVIDESTRYVVASGSLLPGIGNDFYGRLGKIVRWKGARLILDTHGEALKRALVAVPYLVRLNEAEARELAQETDRNVPVEELARAMVGRHVAEIVVIGLGDKGSLVTFAEGQFFIAAPKVAVRSMVGAGDSYVAALTLALSRDWSLDAANRYGVAAAASAVTGEATELCSHAGTEELFKLTGKPVYVAEEQ